MKLLNRRVHLGLFLGQRMLCVMAWLTLLFSSAALHAIENYVPKIPKVALPPTDVIVLDMVDDKREGRFSEGHDAVITSVALQGLINRSESTKIFMKKVPLRGGQWSQLDAVYDLQISEGLIPYDLIEPELDTSKKYPVLSYLLEHYSHLIDGYVLYEPMEGAQTVFSAGDDWTNGGGRCAALNVCTFENAIMVSPNILTYIENEGYSFPFLADTRGLSNIEAADWSIARGHMDDPRRSRVAAGYHHERGFHCCLLV